MAIISISGKIGVGKDTVASLINFLSMKPVSETLFWDLFLKGVALVDSQQPKWKVVKFAYKLKQTASLLTGVPVEKFEDQEFKKKEMPGWGMTYREFLQKLGTEAMRDNLHKDVWVKALFADYKKEDDDNLLVDNGESILDLREYPNWIITDCRFENEAEAVKSHGGILLRINRNGQNVFNILNGHPSETALDNYQFDYVIDNDGSIEELTEKVKGFLIKFNL